MKKQTKLVAVLSTAALLAIGASMTSFAATGWAEEDGTWVYYDRNGDKVTDKWAKSGNNWYYLDSNGEMAVDQLIEDGDNYYYVDVNGVMAANQWVAIDNEDAGDDDEPEHYWYYFQANGKALKQGDSDTVSLKTVNGKKYAFDEYGAMVAEWSLDEDDEKKASDTEAQEAASTASTSEAWEGNGKYAKYTQAWKYYNSVEDGSRVSKGWFKVVPAEMLNKEKPKTIEAIQKLWYRGDMDEVHHHYSSTRYKACNLHSFFANGHWEMRACNSSLHAGVIRSYVTLALAISNAALTKKFCSPHISESDNLRYSASVWLINLGLNGEEFRNCRKHLISHLDGCISWRHPEDAIAQRERLKEERIAAHEHPVSEVLEQCESLPDEVEQAAVDDFEEDYEQEEFEESMDFSISM